MSRVRRWLRAVRFHRRLVDDVAFFLQQYHGLAKHSGSLVKCHDAVCYDELIALREADPERFANYAVLTV